MWLLFDVGTCDVQNYIGHLQVVGSIQNSISAANVDSIIQNVSSTSNHVLEAMEVDVRIMGPADPNWAKITVVDHFPGQEESGGSTSSSGTIM